MGLNNFKILFKDTKFITSMQNTILLIVTVTIITFFFAIVFAAILTREKIKGQNFFRIVFYIPNILSVVVIAGIFSAIYKPDNGMLNSIFSFFAGHEVMVLWKDQPMVIVSIIIAMVWQAIGYYMVMYMASIKQNSDFYGNPWALPFTIYLLSGYFATLPHDFEEAAYIDGAGYGSTRPTPPLWTGWTSSSTSATATPPTPAGRSGRTRRSPPR